MPKRERRIRKGRKPNLSLHWLVAGLFFLSAPAWGAEKLVYKGPRQGSGESKAPSVSQKASPGGETIKDSQGKGYVYDPRGKTDPFKSFIAVQEAVKQKEHAKPKTYLETLDLSQLDLIAIVIKSRDKWAMVREPKGLGHVIRVGTPIGKNGGVVREIKDGEVVIREKYKDFRGKVKVKDITKKLPSLK